MKWIRVVGLALLCLVLLLFSVGCEKSETHPQDTTDSTPPLISNVGSSNITASGSTISWSTDEPATSQVEYGPGSPYGSTTALDSALATTHSVNLVGLTPATAYHFRAKSLDEAGNAGYSPDYSLTTSELAVAINHHSSIDGDGYRIWVTAANQASISVDLTVEIKLYNSSSVRIYLDDEGIKDLDPGETWKVGCLFGYNYWTDIAAYSVELKTVSVSTMPEPITTADITLALQYPKNPLVVLVKNETQRALQSVMFEIKYYWADDGTLRYSQTWGTGPIDAGETVDAGVQGQVGGDLVHTVFLLAYS